MLRHVLLFAHLHVWMYTRVIPTLYFLRLIVLRPWVNIHAASMYVCCTAPVISIFGPPLFLYCSSIQHTQKSPHVTDKIITEKSVVNDWLTDHLAIWQNVFVWGGKSNCSQHNLCCFPYSIEFRTCIILQFNLNNINHPVTRASKPAVRNTGSARTNRPLRKASLTKRKTRPTKENQSAWRRKPVQRGKPREHDVCILCHDITWPFGVKFLHAKFNLNQKTEKFHTALAKCLLYSREGVDGGSDDTIVDDLMTRRSHIILTRLCDFL